MIISLVAAKIQSEKAINFIIDTNTRSDNDECEYRRKKDLEDNGQKSNFAIGYCFLKGEQQPKITHLKNMNEWSIIGYDKEFEESINEDEDKRTYYQDVIGKAGFQLFQKEISRCGSHTEPHYLNNILKALIKARKKVEEIDFLYLHTTLSPCNACNSVIEIYARIFEVRIYVTYDTAYAKGGRIHKRSFKHRLEEPIYKEELT